MPPSQPFCKEADKTVEPRLLEARLKPFSAHRDSSG